MEVKIIDFKPEHLDMMDMRDLEDNLEIDGQELLDESLESKTVLVDDTILCSYGINKINGLWQVPSVHIDKLPMKYARATIRIVRAMIKDRVGVHSICVNDEFHKRWMGFLGFKPTDKKYTIQGCDCILYVR